jgi:phospholipase/carboxylesterase
MTVRYVLDAAHLPSPAVTPSATPAATHSAVPVDAAASTGSTAPSLETWLEFVRGDSSAIFSAPATTGPESPVLYFPEHYEARYAYPLIVWIQSPGRGADAEFRQTMDSISDRNYMGLALRTPLEASLGDATTINQLADRLRTLVGLVRRKHAIHGERIFVAGVGRAGTLALRLVLAQPQWFAGAIAPGAELAGPVPGDPPLLRNFRQLPGKRVLLAAFANLTGQKERTRTLGRLLHSAGLRVCERSYADSSRLPRSAYSDIDRWIMREIYQHHAVTDDAE